MILIGGESLIDLIVDPLGCVHPIPGGGPVNLADPGPVRAAVAAAARVASLTCGRAGAEPPWRHELDASAGRGQLPVQGQGSSAVRY